MENKTVYDLGLDDTFYLVYYNHFYKKYKYFKTHGYNDCEYQGLRDLGQIHLTKAMAEYHARVKNTELKIREFKRKNDKVKTNFKDSSYHKWFVIDNGGSIDYWFNDTQRLPGVIYMSTAKLLETCVKEIGEENILEWINWEVND